ncbi:MAG: hypothetical protein NVS9B15_19210 [Acidobacteriaceae bacterium]
MGNHMHSIKSEQREAVRYKKHQIAAVIFRQGSRQQRIACEIRDVSVGGVALWCDHDFPMGARIILDFASAHDSEAIRVRAIVRNRREHIFGVQYQPRTEAECKSLDWIDNLLVASGFNVGCQSSAEPTPARYLIAGITAVGVALGGLLGGIAHPTMFSTIVGGALGLICSYSACTI